MNYHLKIASLIALSAFAFGCKKVDIPDQSQTESLDASRSAIAFAPMGQSFVPTANKLDYIKLKMNDGGGWPEDHIVHINVRESTIDGPVVGVSETLTLEDCFNFEEGPGCNLGGGYSVEVRFNFPERVSLVPGDSYVFEVEVENERASLNVAYSYSDVYEAGGSYDEGVLYPRDLWFEEGYTQLKLDSESSESESTRVSEAD